MLPRIEIGGLSLMPYPLVVTAAIIAGISVIWLLLSKEDRSGYRFLAVIAAGAIGAFAGARLLSVLSQPGFHDPVTRAYFGTWWYLRNGGFSFGGAFIGAAALASAAAWLVRWKVLKFLDAGSVGAYLMLAIGRVGCLLAGCCYGRPTLFPVALVFNDFRAPVRPIGVPLHAVQVYEMLAALASFFVLLAVHRKARTDGIVFYFSLILYPAMRLFLDGLRGGERLMAYGFSFNQWFCALLVLSGSMLLLLRRRSAVRKKTLLPILALVLGSSLQRCNPYDRLPPALCLENEDCIGGETCVEGKCAFTDELALEVYRVGYQAAPDRGDLVIEASKCRFTGDLKRCDGKPLNKKVRSPGFPFRTAFAPAPKGEYLVTACIDNNFDGKCSSPDPGTHKVIETRPMGKKSPLGEVARMIIQYPLLQ
jgi:phosphatidylglycerol:prolipoprotein diacylglycerol transferase